MAVFCKMVLRRGWAVVFSEVLMEKEVFGVAISTSPPYGEGRRDRRFWPVSKAASVQLQLLCCVCVSGGCRRVTGLFRPL